MHTHTPTYTPTLTQQMGLDSDSVQLLHVIMAKYEEEQRNIEIEKRKKRAEVTRTNT